MLKYFRTAARWNSLRIHWHFQETYPDQGAGEKLEKEVLCDSQIVFPIFIFKKVCVCPHLYVMYASACYMHKGQRLTLYSILDQNAIHFCFRERVAYGTGTPYEG